MLKRWSWLCLLLVLVLSVGARTDRTYFFDTGNLTISPVSFASGKAVCLADGTNCPASVAGSYNGWLLVAGNSVGTYNVTDTAQVNITGGSGVTVTRSSGKLQINATSTGNNGTVTSVAASGPYLTGGTITASGTIAVNTSAFCLADGTNCAAGTSLTLSQWLVNWSSSNIGNATSLAAGLNNLSLAQVSANLKMFVNVSTGNQTILSNASQLTFTNNAYATWGMPNSGNITLVTSLSSFNTDNLLEGSTNLYYTYPRWLTSWSNSNIGNATSLAAGLVNLTTAQAAAALQNTSIVRVGSNKTCAAGTTLQNVSLATTGLIGDCVTDQSGGSGAGNITGGGSANYVPKWGNATQIINSVIQDLGSIVNISSNLSVGVGNNNTVNLSVAGNDLLIQSSRYVAINTTTPTATLTVRGTTNFTGGVNMGGIPASSGGKFVCIDASGNLYTAVTSCVTG